MHMTVNERPLSGIIERLMYDRYYGASSATCVEQWNGARAYVHEESFECRHSHNVSQSNMARQRENERASAFGSRALTDRTSAMGRGNGTQVR